MRNLSFLLALLPLACSSATTSQGPSTPNPGGGGDPGSGDPGATQPACTPLDPTTIAGADVLGSPSLDLSDTHLAFGYVDPTSVPTIQAYELATQNIVTGKWASSKSAWSHYGSSYVTTSLAHQGDRFGMAWYSERTSALSSDGAWAVRFATMSAADGKVSPADYASPETGRYDSRDLVIASSPVVSPTTDGFFVAWSDMRTAEPSQMNVNIAGWHGLYGQAFDANGRAQGEDVQIAQPILASSYKGVQTSDRFTMYFSGSGDAVDGRDRNLYSRSNAGTDFSPAQKPTPFAMVRSDEAIGVTSAVGPDGRTLMLVRSKMSTPVVGSVMFGTNGQVESKYKVWTEADVDWPLLAPSADGYVVAAAEPTTPGGPETKAIRLVFLDANGAKTSESRIELPSSDRAARGIAVRATTSGLFVASILGPATTKTGANHYDVFLASVCPAAK